MGFYGEQILPRAIDKLLGGAAMAEIRRPTVEQIDGVVCEIGFGSGPNVPLYPEGVERVYAIDPSPVGWKLAADRVASSRVPVDSVGLDGAALPLDDGSVDTVLSTWTLCTIPDVDGALTEIARVLRPGGRLVFLEHGLSDDPRTARRQHRFTPIQRRIAGGCHLDRDIAAILDRSPLTTDELKRFQIAGLKSASAMYAGVASRSRRDG